MFRERGLPIVFTNSAPANTPYAGKATKSKRTKAPPPGANDFPEAITPREGEEDRREKVRNRTVGDANLTAEVRSEATTVEEVIAEIAVTRMTERGATRGDDKVSDAAMEDRKKEGYF